MPYCDPAVEAKRQARKYQTIKRTKPFTQKCWSLKSKATAFGIPFNLTPQYLEQIWTGCCAYSDHSISLWSNSRRDEWSAEVDRVIPSVGYVRGNVVWISRRFNRLKSDGTAEEHYQIAIRLESLRKEYENKT